MGGVLAVQVSAAGAKIWLGAASCVMVLQPRPAAWVSAGGAAGGCEGHSANCFPWQCPGLLCVVVLVFPGTST